MIKDEFAVIITTVEDTPEEQEGFEIFKKYYQKKLFRK